MAENNEYIFCNETFLIRSLTVTKKLRKQNASFSQSFYAILRNSQTSSATESSTLMKNATKTVLVILLNFIEISLEQKRFCKFL